MKFEDIEITTEEVLQSLRDVGIKILEPGDPEFDEALTVGEQVKTMLEKEVILDRLYNIVIELDARQTSNNCVVDDLQQFSWDELCDEGAQLFKKLKT